MLRDLYRRVRERTVALAAPLAAEDQVVQTMPDVSPTKWHLAHTSWFFETFILRPAGGYVPLDERYATLFNSYYVGAGDRYPRPERGHLSRPTVAEVHAYRRHVDAAMEAVLDDDRFAFTIELGVNHEEQHQELILTDVKHVLCMNPLAPAYRPRPAPAAAAVPGVEWIAHPGGFVDIGCSVDTGDGAAFAFDNERPRHAEWLRPHALASRPVTCGEWRAFMDDGGYDRPELWLSDGWDARERGGWRAPLYWTADGQVATLGGLRPVHPAEPVCHVSHYEADAYARWAGARLPSEAEWEAAAATRPLAGNFLEREALHPQPARATQMFGDVWEWTASPYLAYPGFQPFAGALGEYNGKFMANRMVLRGGSCLTPARHVRRSYRNFFPSDARWQMTGLRLARDA
jgi:ergothioneine biosynthesis protein EgtB